MPAKMKIIIGIADASIPVWKFINEIMFNQLLWRKIRNKNIMNGDSLIKLWIDSGGYQYMMHGRKPALEELLNTYKEIEQFSNTLKPFFMMLDMPPRNIMDRNSWKRNIDLYEELISRYSGESVIVPIIHFYYPSIHILEALDHYKAYNPPIIAYGGIIPPLLKKTRYRLPSLLGLLLLRRSWNRKIHVLGAGSPIMIRLARIIGTDSADTSTWRVKAAYGNILVPGKGERNIGRAKAWRAPRANDNDLVKLKHFLIETGFPQIGKFDELIKTFRGRAIINLWVIAKMDPYKWGSGGFQWLEKRLLKYMKYSTDELLSEIDRLVKGITR